ncbi:MAG: Asp-tRNA(Asn)/Glu-tRNA(Gln) amidotransferase subunit GatA, partial [Opitutae bacterium]|nr:Asp-tRNA(Asn)/Glu-tRNA(Gln) amidotransferase subunit GatA [Opitutae bacterium]
MADDLIFRPAAGLAVLLDAKKISSVELVQAFAARRQAVDGRVKAFNSLDAAGALALAAASDARRAAGQARGPLDGVPVGFKDVIAVAGQPLTCSSRMLANFVSPYDATV